MDISGPHSLDDIIAVLIHFGDLPDDVAAAAREALDQYRSDKADAWRRQIEQIASLDGDRRLIDEAARIAAYLEGAR